MSTYFTLITQLEFFLRCYLLNILKSFVISFLGDLLILRICEQFYVVSASLYFVFYFNQV